MNFHAGALLILLVGIPSSGGSSQTPALGNLSERSAKAVLVMRHMAGSRGAASVTLNDLILGLIVEDQDPNVKLLFGTGPDVLYPSASKQRQSFFPASAATYVLARLYELLPRSAPLSDSTDIPISPELYHVLQVANALPARYNQQKVSVHGQSSQAVVPLDLLAAALQERCDGTEFLAEVGITEEKVIETIKRGGDLENWNPPEASK